MTINPTLDQVQAGDQFGSDLKSVKGRSWVYVSTVLSVEPMTKRFGKQDRIVKVCIKTSDGYIVDNSKLIWFSQLALGLV